MYQWMIIEKWRTRLSQADASRQFHQRLHHAPLAIMGRLVEQYVSRFVALATGPAFELPIYPP